MADDSAATVGAGKADDDELGFSGERDRDGMAAEPSATDPGLAQGESLRRRSFDARDLPEGMEARFLIERRRLTGERRYYETASDTKPAFRDKGDRLVADNNSRDLIRDMLEIAEHRGWNRVRVSGSEEFRREAWREAALRGIKVDGYRPKPRELQEVARARDQRDARANVIATSADQASGPRAGRSKDGSEPRGEQRPSPARPAFNEGVAGRLADVGEAHYGGKPSGKITPYADIILDDGSQERAWGVGLPAALGRSGAGVGDRVILQRLGAERVQIPVAVLDVETGERIFEVREVNRNRWSAERLLTPEVEEALKYAEPSRKRMAGEAGFDLAHGTVSDGAAGLPQNRARVSHEDRAEHASDAGSDLHSIRTARTCETTDGRVPTLVAPIDAHRGPPHSKTSNGSDLFPRGADPSIPNAVFSDIVTQDRRIGLAGGRYSGVLEGEGIDLSNRNPNQQLADRFREATSAVAAKDPQLRAAQSQFIAAKAIVTSTLGHKPVAAQRLIDQSRETIARAIEQGRAVPAAELRAEKIKSAASVRQRVQRIHSAITSEDAAVTKTPTRNRAR